MVSELSPSIRDGSYLSAYSQRLERSRSGKSAARKHLLCKNRCCRRGHSPASSPLVKVDHLSCSVQNKHWNFSGQSVVSPSRKTSCRQPQSMSEFRSCGCRHVDRLVTAIRPEVQIAMVAVQDIGSIGAASIADPNKSNRIELELTDDRLNMRQIAVVLSEAMGVPLSAPKPDGRRGDCAGHDARPGPRTGVDQRRKS